jgi:hypothetical protein
MLAASAKPNAAAWTAAESDAVKKRFDRLSAVAPDADERTREVDPGLCGPAWLSYERSRRQSALEFAMPSH